MTHVDVTISLDTYNTANSREHWGTRARNARRQRAAVGKVLSAKPMPRGPWVVTLTRIAERLLDTDGLTSSLKAVRDAVADRLGCDDGPRAPVTWRYEQGRGPRGVRIEIGSRGEEPSHPLRRERTGGAGETPFGGEDLANAGQGGALGAEGASTREGLLLAFVRHERSPVGGDAEAEGHGPNAFAARLLRAERETCARADHRPLELGHRVQDAGHENRFRALAGGDPVRRCHGRTEAPHKPFDGRGDERGTRQTIAPGHGEKARPVTLKVRERIEHARAFVGRCGATKAVDVPRHDPHPFSGRPSLDLGLLRIEAERLVRGAYAQVTDRRPRIP
jgi:hypothetical protein